MGYLFQISLSIGCTLALYEEQAFWNTFFQFPLSRGCTLWHSYEEQTFWDTFFNPPYQESVFRHYMRNRHFGIHFSIPPIKRLYSLAIYLGTGISEYLFQLPLSRGCTLWHYMRNRHFGIPFSIAPIKSVYSLALYGYRHFGIPFQIPPIKWVYSLAFI